MVNRLQQYGLLYSASGCKLPALMCCYVGGPWGGGELLDQQDPRHSRRNCINSPQCGAGAGCARCFHKGYLLHPPKDLWATSVLHLYEPKGGFVRPEIWACENQLYHNWVQFQMMLQIWSHLSPLFPISGEPRTFSFSHLREFMEDCLNGSWTRLMLPSINHPPVTVNTCKHPPACWISLGLRTLLSTGILSLSSLYEIY